MSDSESGGAARFQHRARLFPLPYSEVPTPPPAAAVPSTGVAPPSSSLSSARVRHRLRVARSLTHVSNACVAALNRLYAPPSLVSFSSRVSLSCRPGTFPPPPTSTAPPSLIDGVDHSHSLASPFVSSGQRRVVASLVAQCARFVQTVRVSLRASSVPDSAIWPQLLSELAHLHGGPSPSFSLSSSAPIASHQAHASTPHATHADSTAPPVSPLPPSSYSSAAATVVPLVARRIALPEQLHIVPMQSVLPPSLAADYSPAAAPRLLRSALEVQLLHSTQPLRRPRIAGSRTEYVSLIHRMHAQGMVSLTSTPQAVNGVFAVAKDAESDRLIIDAQPANRLFVDSPHVALPNPSHLVQLTLNKGERCFVAKSDLSNFYHHIGLPSWMQPYFCLPPLSPMEFASIGLESASPFPMCTTLPMGFAHAVFLAQAAHEHIVYGSGALQRCDSLLSLTAPAVTHARALHGIVIDDFFLFSLNQALAARTLAAVLAAYQHAGFIVKRSKLVQPTTLPVRVIGFDIDGAQGSIRLPPDSLLSLVQSTLRILRLDTVSGTLLAHLVGRWTWFFMLRRPVLCVFQHVYRYSELARGRPFTLWPSVRNELRMALALLPLLHADLTAPFAPRVFASDASELAAGVVQAGLTPAFHSDLWPLCSTRHHAVHQALANAQHMRAAHTQHALEPAHVAVTLDPAASLSPSYASPPSFAAYYRAVAGTRWRSIVSSPWSGVEHINVLELRAALLAMHRCFSSPSSHSSRVYLLVDSTVAFFTLWKGRSSSPQLLLVLRKINAMLLAGGIVLLPGWLPSAANPADAPSRLKPSGTESHRTSHDD